MDCVRSNNHSYNTKTCPERLSKEPILEALSRLFKISTRLGIMGFFIYPNSSVTPMSLTFIEQEV